MKHHTHSHNLRFFWSPATAVFPNRNTQQMRTRIDKIKNLPSIAEYIYTLNRLWPQFYQQGLAERAFEEQEEKPLDYNILERITYFIQRLQDMNKYVPTLIH